MITILCLSSITPSLHSPLNFSYIFPIDRIFFVQYSCLSHMYGSFISIFRWLRLHVQRYGGEYPFIQATMFGIRYYDISVLVLLSLAVGVFVLLWLAFTQMLV